MGNARKTVLRLLTRLENSGSYSNILLDEGLERSDLSPQDKNSPQLFSTAFWKDR